MNYLVCRSKTGKLEWLAHNHEWTPMMHMARSIGFKSTAEALAKGASEEFLTAVYVLEVKSEFVGGEKT